MKNDYKLIMVLLVVFLAVIAIQKMLNNPAESQKRMLKVVESIKQTCPVIIDDETRLDSITLVSGYAEIVFYHTLLYMVNDTSIIAEFEERMNPLIIENTRNNPDLRIFRINNMVISNGYMDKNGEFMCKISVSPEVYKNIENSEELEVHLE